MRLAVDARILHAPNAGSAYYTRGWLSALPGAGFQGDCLLIGPAATTPLLGNGLPAYDVIVEGARLCDETWEQTELPPLLQELKPDVFISPASVLPMLKSCPQVSVVYDLGFELHPQFYAQPLRRYLRSWVPRSCRVADAVVASAYGIGDQKVTVCPGAVDERFAPVDQRDRLREAKEKYGIRGRYVLSVCSLERNKNLPRLLEALALALESTNDRWTLVLTGRPGQAMAEIQTLVQSLDIEDAVVLTGFVPDDDLPVLYAGACIFAFVSLYEGFGLPPLEAMACGAPVLASDATSLPEVIGDAGVLVDPEDVEAIRDGLCELMAHPVMRRDLGKRGMADDCLRHVRGRNAHPDAGN